MANDTQSDEAVAVTDAELAAMLYAARKHQGKESGCSSCARDMERVILELQRWKREAGS